MIINNLEYYYAIENQVRSGMEYFEENFMLPKVQNFLVESNVSQNTIVDYPVEGYYYKTQGLKEYFTIIRNLQYNPNVFNKLDKKNKEYEFMVNYLGMSLWGNKKSAGKYDPYYRKEIDSCNFPRIKDGMTLCMDDLAEKYGGVPHPWSTDNIMANLKNFCNDNTNLVNFAYMINNVEPLVCATETNCLYRDISICSGCATGWIVPSDIWNVSKSVQDMGEKICDAYYNKIFSNIPMSKKRPVIYVPRLSNWASMDYSPEIPRVSMLGADRITHENYYWILTKSRKVIEKYTNEFITTKSYIDKDGV